MNLNIYIWTYTFHRVPVMITTPPSSSNVYLLDPKTYSVYNFDVVLIYMFSHIPEYKLESNLILHFSQS